MKKIFSLVSVLIVAFTLAGCKSEDVTNPEIKGADDVTLALNEAFDPKTGVTATDNVDGDITSNIEIFGAVNTAKEGDYVLRYKVIDKAGNKDNVLRKVKVVYNCTVTDELYCNSDFVAGTSGWGTYFHDNGAAGEFTVENGVAKYTMSNIPDNSMYWSHQLFRENLTIVQGKSYLLTFKAKADVARKIAAVVEDPNDNYLQYGKYQVYDVTTEWQDFELYFDATKGTVSAKLGLFFGKVANDVTLTSVYLDDIILKEVTARVDETDPEITGAGASTIEVGATFNPLSGVTATDNKDGDITSSIVVSGDTVDTNTAGTYTVTYTVADAAGNDVSVSRVITVIAVTFTDSGLISNGDFSSPLNAETPEWSKVANDGAVFTYSVVNGELVVNVEAGGGNPWSSQLVYGDITLEKGKTYKFVFKAKADTARSINLSGGETLSADPWWRGFFASTVNLSTDYQIFEYVFTMTQDTFTNTDVKFEFGTGAANKIYFDNIVLVELTSYVDDVDPVITGAENTTLEIGGTFNPLTGVSASDNKDGDITSSIVVTGDTVDTNTAGTYTVTYTVTDAAGNDVSVTRVITVVALVFNDTTKIVNGDFSDNTDTITNVAEETNWKEFHQNWGDQQANVVFTINENGELVANITALGNEWKSWTIQLQQAGIPLENGKTYKIVFDAKASVARDIKSVMKTTGDVVYTEKIITLSDTMTTYEHMFTVTKDSNNDMIFAIEMGTFTGTPAESIITLDNIVIKELAEESVISNGDMSNTGWDLWYMRPEWNGTADASFSIVNGEAVVDIANTGDKNWNVQLSQSNIKLEKDMTYKITFDAKAENARYMEMPVGFNVGNDWVEISRKQDINLTTTWQTFTHEFTFTGDTFESAILKFELGQYVDGNGDIISANGKVYFDKISIVEQDASDTSVYHDTNEIINGTFDQAVGFTSWWGDNGSGYASGSVTVVDGVLVADLQTVGTAAYAPQLYQDGLLIKGNRTYIIEFDIKADVARAINVQLGQSLTDAPWFNSFMETKVVNVTTDWQRVIVSFDMTQVTNENGKLVFEMGQINDESGNPVTGANKIYIDNIIIYSNFN